MKSPPGPADNSLILTNALVVTRDRAFIGTVEVMQQHIVAVYRGRTALPGAIDLDGDYLLPGLVELSTRNLCRHLLPRPGVRSSVLSAVLAHDAEMVGAGITTTFDRFQCDDGRLCLSAGELGELAGVLRFADRSGLTRSEHRLGLGVAIDGGPAGTQRAAANGSATPLSVETLGGDARRKCGVGDSPDTGGTALRPRRAASMVPGSAAVGACPGVCEFPASLAMAQAARAARLKVMVAATSLIGESIAPSPCPGTREAALSIAAENLIDILASDDYPPSLLQGAFRLHRSPVRMALPEAIATVSATPAQVASLTDRGEIAPGKRADLIRVHSFEALPITREVWRAGVRVY